jgi:hypothetical protein
MTLNIGQRTSSATGGSISTISGYTVHTFTSSGNFVPSGNGTIEVLVVGGGGSGNPNPMWGGGGGGNVIYNKFVNVTSGTPYPITVGTIGGISSCTFNNTNIIAYGGGNSNGESSPFASGAGGSSYQGTAGGTGAGVTGRGFPGAPYGGGGGGGGASSAGGFGGGIGVSYSITGTSQYYGGGGAGGGGGLPNGGLTPTSYGTGGAWPGTPGAVIIRYPT